MRASWLLFGLLALSPAQAQTTQPRTVRVAITGGIDDNGLWQQLSERFEQRSGIESLRFCRQVELDRGGFRSIEQPTRFTRPYGLSHN